MSLPDFKTLDLDLAEGWLTVWFNTPERRNPLSLDRVEELLTLCTALQDRRDIRGVVIRGRGGVFCAGGDLKAFQAAFQGDGAREALIGVSKHGAAVFDAIDQLPQFVVIVVEGPAMAGGFGIVCCGDMVIAEAGAKFALTETRIGIVAAQIAPLVLRRLGRAATRRLMLAAASLDGAQAQAVGLADVVVDGQDGIDAELATVRDQIRRASPNALAVTKCLIREVEDLPRAAQIDRAANDFASCLLSEDGKEGVTSFMQKKQPKWADPENV